MATQEKARQLLERLATDDAFRALMESSPAEAFAEYGFTIDQAEAPASVNLPSKEDILANIDLLAQQVEQSVGYIIFAR